MNLIKDFVCRMAPVLCQKLYIEESDFNKEVFS
jgi:hypothetical protein